MHFHSINLYSAPPSSLVAYRTIFRDHGLRRIRRPTPRLPEHIWPQWQSRSREWWIARAGIACCFWVRQVSTHTLSLSSLAYVVPSVASHARYYYRSPKLPVIIRKSLEPRTTSNLILIVSSKQDAPKSSSHPVRHLPAMPLLKPSTHYQTKRRARKLIQFPRIAVK